ncbi:GNAT family N-acetyltransferase [Amycolatopsis keratiniphila]|uniref:Cyclic nucleotide-binding protein n=1 Tax=Amycolatopsis keratiniphila subsp. keratiniphila TaxID=227715 RepID=A0A1W2M184_9PSEU|nr:GNAT family N-acetyltransferase [Amycolatopsis keratiniphila]ONF73603.1 cyclic nucleotide-binding protein [Amycolatopsis keratiniphila subsp. keratiniphila]
MNGRSTRDADVDETAKVTLRDGRTVSVRRLTSADAAELGEAIRHADAGTLHGRFCGPPPKVTPRLLEHLTELDFHRRYALVAREPDGHGVAVARYEATQDPGVAEIAVAVDPRWRRAGVASALIRRLAVAALRNGFDRFTVTYLADNRPVADLLDETHVKRVISQGIAEATVPLEQSPERTER